MRLETITDSQRNQFNEYIDKKAHGHVFQLYEWGELKRHTSWMPIRLMVYDQNQPRAAISILQRKIPGLNKNIFYAPRGPVCDYQDYEVMDFLWKEIAKIAKANHAILLKIDPAVTVEDRDFTHYLSRAGFNALDTGKDFSGIQPRFIMQLPLNADPEDLLAAMASKTRYNIRYATRKGVTIHTDGLKDEVLPIFYKILQATAERDHFGIRNQQYFSDMWDHLVETGYAKLFMAKYDDEYIAGTLAFICGNRVWYSYGASDKMRNKQPSYLLQWAMIEWAVDQGCAVYDFRGISGDLNEDNPLYGLYRFKKGFGAQFTEYIGEYDLVFSPFYYFIWEKAMPVAKKWRSHFLKLLRR